LRKKKKKKKKGKRRIWPRQYTNCVHSEWDSHILQHWCRKYIPWYEENASPNIPMAVITQISLMDPNTNSNYFNSYLQLDPVHKFLQTTNSKMWGKSAIPVLNYMVLMSWITYSPCKMTSNTQAFHV
jgi:hypothetical protein